MKPIYRSKKAWSALFALVAVCVAHYTGNEALTLPIMVLGAALVSGFGLADFGKEKAALELAVFDAAAEANGDSEAPPDED